MTRTYQPASIMREAVQDVGTFGERDAFTVHAIASTTDEPGASVTVQVTVTDVSSAYVQCRTTLATAVAHLDHVDRRDVARSAMLACDAIASPVYACLRDAPNSSAAHYAFARYGSHVIADTLGGIVRDDRYRHASDDQ